MTFAGILFRLLIVGICCKRGFCQNYETEYLIELSSVEAWKEESGASLGKYLTAYLRKIKSSNTFAIYDTNQATLLDDIFENKVFTPSRLEFISMYQLKLIFVFRRSNDRVYVLCEFLDENGIQKFFDSVNRHKPKDASIKIHKIGRYPISDDLFSSLRLNPLAEQAELSVRDITESILIARKIYYISHTSNTNEKKEADLIFISGRFSFSALSNGNTIALCVMDNPDEHFLIRFSDQENPRKFINDYVQGKESDENCPFPYLTRETINYLNGY